MKNKFWGIASIIFFLQLVATNFIFAAPPVNDDLANAVVIGSTPFTASVSAVDSDDATPEPNEIACSSGFYYGTWWYSITLTESGVLTADALTLNAVAPVSNSNAVNVAIYSGTIHPLTQLACDGSFQRIPNPVPNTVPPDPRYEDMILDIPSSLLNPSVSTLVPAGTYFIAVGNSGSTTTEDDIAVNVNFVAAPLSSPENIPVNNPFALMILVLSLFVFTYLFRRKEHD